MVPKKEKRLDKRNMGNETISKTELACENAKCARYVYLMSEWSNACMEYLCMYVVSVLFLQKLPPLR